MKGNVMNFNPWSDFRDKSHIHALIREVFEDRDGKYLYRCLTCNVRLKRKSGVLVAAPAAAPIAEPAGEGGAK